MLTAGHAALATTSQRSSATKMSFQTFIKRWTERPTLGCESLPPETFWPPILETHNGVCSSSLIGAKFAEVILAVCRNTRDLLTCRREGDHSPVHGRDSEVNAGWREMRQPPGWLTHHDPTIVHVRRPLIDLETIDDLQCSRHGRHRLEEG